MKIRKHIIKMKAAYWAMKLGHPDLVAVAKDNEPIFIWMWWPMKLFFKIFSTNVSTTIMAGRSPKKEQPISLCFVTEKHKRLIWGTYQSIEGARQIGKALIAEADRAETWRKT